MGTSLAELPDLQPREQLDATLTVRLSRADRQSFERVARQLGVTPGRLLRAIARKALAEADRASDPSK